MGAVQPMTEIMRLASATALAISTPVVYTHSVPECRHNLDMVTANNTLYCALLSPTMKYEKLFNKQ